jgi:hypothetical protein
MEVMNMEDMAVDTVEVDTEAVDMGMADTETVDMDMADTEAVDTITMDTVVVVVVVVVDMEAVGTVAVDTEATGMDIMRKEVGRNTNLNSTQVMAIKLIRDTKAITNMRREKKDTMTRRDKVGTTMITGVRSQNIMRVAVILANIITVRRERREQNMVKKVDTKRDTALRVSTTSTRRTSTRRIMSSMTSITREENTASTEISMGIMSIRTEVTKREDITTQNIMRNIMERRDITTRVTIMTMKKATRKNMATRSTMNMKMTMLRRVTMKKERNGDIVVAREVAVDMEVGMGAVGTEADMAVGTEVDTEMEDMVVGDTKLAVVVNAAETMLFVVLTVIVGETRCLLGI